MRYKANSLYDQIRRKHDVETADALFEAFGAEDSELFPCSTLGFFNTTCGVGDRSKCTTRHIVYIISYAADVLQIAGSRLANFPKSAMDSTWNGSAIELFYANILVIAISVSPDDVGITVLQFCSAVIQSNADGCHWRCENGTIIALVDRLTDIIGTCTSSFCCKYAGACDNRQQDVAFKKIVKCFGGPGPKASKIEAARENIDEQREACPLYMLYSPPTIETLRAGCMNLLSIRRKCDPDQVDAFAGLFTGNGAVAADDNKQSGLDRDGETERGSARPEVRHQAAARPSQKRRIMADRFDPSTLKVSSSNDSISTFENSTMDVDGHLLAQKEHGKTAATVRLERKNAEKTTAIVRLEHENAEKTTAIAELEQKVAKMTSAKDELEQEIAEKTSAKDVLEQEIAKIELEHEQEIAEIKIEHEQAQSILQLQEQKARESLSESFQSDQREFKKKRENLRATLQGEIDNLNFRVCTLNLTKEQMSAERDRILVEVGRLEQSNERLCSDLAGREKEVAERDEEVRELTVQVGVLETRINEPATQHASSIDSLSTVIEKVRTDMMSLAVEQLTAAHREELGRVKSVLEASAVATLDQRLADAAQQKDAEVEALRTKMSAASEAKVKEAIARVTEKLEQVHLSKVELMQTSNAEKMDKVKSDLETTLGEVQSKLDTADAAAADRIADAAERERYIEQVRRRRVCITWVIANLNECKKISSPKPWPRRCGRGTRPSPILKSRGNRRRTWASS